MQYEQRLLHPVLHLDAQARAAEQVGQVVPLVEVDRTHGQARRVGGSAGDVDLGGLGNDSRRQVGELTGMQVDHAARHHHDRLARKPQRMAYGLRRVLDSASPVTAQVLMTMMSASS